MTRHEDNDRFETADAVRRAVEASDWEAVRLRLHPYLHRRATDDYTLRGRVNVLAMLRDS